MVQFENSIIVSRGSFSDIIQLFVYKLKKELIINIYMLIKSIIKAG
jgi:hypothetical protein